MPVYEYRCNDTGKYFQIRYKTYTEYDNATPRSPFTGSENVTQVIRGVNIARSFSSQLDALESGDTRMLDDLENADPQTLGRTLRHMEGRLGEDMGQEFHEVVDRLESGQSPEQVASTMEANLSASDTDSDS